MLEVVSNFMNENQSKKIAFKVTRFQGYFSSDSSYRFRIFEGKYSWINTELSLLFIPAQSKTGKMATGCISSEPRVIPYGDDDLICSANDPEGHTHFLLRSRAVPQFRVHPSKFKVNVKMADVQFLGIRLNEARNSTPASSGQKLT